MNTQILSAKIFDLSDKDLTELYYELRDIVNELDAKEDFQKYYYYSSKLRSVSSEMNYRSL